MTTDEIRAELQAAIRSDKRAAAILRKIAAGRASFTDTMNYSLISGRLTGQQLSAAILELSEGREELAEALLHDRYEDINAQCAAVQTSLDEKNGLRLAPQKAAFPSERVAKFAHSLIDPTVSDETIKRRAKSGPANITMSFHDNFIKENADFRTKAGLECYVERQTDGKCCPWCSAVAGRYLMREQPKDLFRRHDNCECVIIYDEKVLRGQKGENGRRGRRWVEEPPKVEYTPPKRFSHDEAEKLQAELLPRRLTGGVNGGIIENGMKMSAPKQNPPDFSKYQIKTDLEAVEAAKERLQNALGDNLAGVNFTGIQNADALSPFVSQLIKIHERTGMKFPSIVAREIIDNDLCCIASFQPYENTLYISSKYFNSKKALETTLKQWAKDKFMPKQATNIAYLAEHEAAHIRISISTFHKDKAKELFMSRIMKNSNDKQIHEYFADVVAIFNRDPNIDDENIISAVEFLKEEGVKI